MNSRAAMQLEEAGFAVFPDILDADEVREISRQLVLLRTANAGSRRLLSEPWCLGLGQRLMGDIRFTNDETGALRIVPGSHALGRLTADSIQRVRDVLGEVAVPVLRGGAMVMRPLLLHASHKVTVDQPRRVLHFVYGPSKLPYGLRWPPSDGISDGTARSA